MTKKESILVAANLLVALYAAPHHGPAIISTLPSGQMLPDLTTGALYAEMMQHGLSSGHLDYALFDAQVANRSRRAYEQLTNEGRFMLSQKTHEDDPSMMITWAEMLREHHLNNEIAKDLKSFINLAEEGKESTANLVGRVIGSMKEYVESGAGGMNHIRKACSQALERTQDWKEGISSDSLLTGFPSIDDLIGGFSVSHMSVMAGMTSGFKTAALVELMKRVALRFEKRDEKQAVVIFSAEMSAEKLTHRLASNISGVPQQNIKPTRANFLPRGEDYEKYEAAIAKISGLEIYVNQEPNPTFETMYAQCLNIQAKMPIAFVGFDYLEKMEVSEGAASEELRVSKIAKDLSRLAKRLVLPVITLSQYSNKSQTNGNQLPSDGWLRYSGKTSHEAAEIIHWYYPKYFVDRGGDPGGVKLYDPANPDRIFAVCTKNRDGKLASIELKVEPETGRFIDPQDARYEPTSEEAPF